MIIPPLDILSVGLLLAVWVAVEIVEARGWR